MTASPRAHFLLPTPLGLVRYDILEDAAFLGMGPRGGLAADPVPFKKASVAVTREAGGFVVRALPGEAPPEVNGVPSENARLKDGDRLKIGDQVAMFRGASGPAAAASVPVAVVATGAPPPHPAPSVGGAAPLPRIEREPRAATPPPPRGPAYAATALSLLGAGLVVVAVYRAVQHLQVQRPTAVPEPPTIEVVDSKMPREEERAAKEYAAAAAFETAHAGDVEGAILRYRQFLKDRGGSREADLASSRIAELWPKAAAAAWGTLKADADVARSNRKYRTLLQRIREFESKFAGTEAAAETPALTEKVRTEARAALDAVREKAAPLLASDPTRAYRYLYGADLELPPDLEGELGAMMARARELWGTPEPPTNGHSGTGPGPGSRPGTPGGGTKPPGGTSTAPPIDANVKETYSRALWDQAHADLVAKKYEAAVKAYDILLKDYTDTQTVIKNVAKIESGQKAADLGFRGPGALLRHESTFKKGRLEVEYQFDDPQELSSDFTIDQPIPGSEEQQASVKEGMVVLSGSTMILHNIVYDPDATWEAECFSDEPRDYGLIAFQEGFGYRTLGWEVGNTQLRLKKGSNAKIPAGHVLFLFGDNVWRDADPGERGWVRLGLQPGNRLARGESTRVKLEVGGDKASGEIHAKNENVNLSGAIKGDDGKSIGPFRLGVFAYTSVVGVERLTISGHVNQAWLDKKMEELLKGDPGPE